MELKFHKYQGTGNDFVVLDNRTGMYDGLTTAQVKKCCDRRFGIGADGFMLLQNAAGYDFEMIYYNADGNKSSMCGNGARCMIQFAHFCGIHKSIYHFLAIDGAHEGEIEEQNIVRLKMSDVDKIENYQRDFIVNTGSPHYVQLTTRLAEKDVEKDGREIRSNKTFIQEGINVNFVEQENNDGISVRTYERGVENETLSCGTGVTASALVFAHNELGYNMVKVKTPGGKLSVEFDKTGKESFRNIWLNGPAVRVFEGTIII